MPKLYMMEFADRKTSKKFHKFGWTGHRDAVERFKDPSYNDFDIKCVASLFHPSKDVILALESAFLSMFPKNIWLEEYLGDDRRWGGFSGITEIVHLTDDEYRRAKSAFYDVKERLNAKSKAQSDLGDV